MARMRATRWTQLTRMAALTAAMLVAGPATADLGPRIDRVEILVLGLPDHGQIGTVRPGGTLDLEAGQSVRLRMSAVPHRRGPRYPSARFEVVSGERRLIVQGANEEVGNVTLTAYRVESRRDEPTVIRYEITEPLDISRELRTGEFLVRVREPSRVAVDPTPYPPTNGYRQSRGITLYSDAGFRGESETFDVDVTNLRGTLIREDRASSARLDPGCQAVLYDHPDFQGVAFVLDHDVADFSRDPRIHNDVASSLRVECD